MDPTCSKRGSKVIPGNTTYDTGYTGVSINPTHLGIPVSAYLSQLVGKRIYGLTSGVTAEVVNFITPEESILILLRYIFHIFHQTLEIMLNQSLMMGNF